MLWQLRHLLLIFSFELQLPFAFFVSLLQKQRENDIQRRIEPCHPKKESLFLKTQRKDSTGIGEQLKLIRKNVEPEDREPEEYLNGSLLKGDHESHETNDQIKKMKKIVRMVGDKRMLYYCLVQVFFELAFYIPMVFLSEKMQRYDGISKEKAGTIFMVLGLSVMLGRAISGMILQYSKLKPIVFSILSMALQGMCSIGFTLCIMYEHFAIVTVIYGLVLSSIEVLIPPICIEIFGVDKLKDTYGLVMMARMFCPLWGPPLAGALYNWTGNYNLAFYTAGSFQLIGSAFNILVL